MIVGCCVAHTFIRVNDLILLCGSKGRRSGFGRVKNFRFCQLREVGWIPSPLSWRSGNETDGKRGEKKNPSDCKNRNGARRKMVIRRAPLSFSCCATLRGVSVNSCFEVARPSRATKPPSRKTGFPSSVSASVDQSRRSHQPEGDPSGRDCPSEPAGSRG